MSGVIIAAGFGPLMTEDAATALIPLMATLRSFVAKGTGYTLGTFVTALGSLVTDTETTPRFGAFVRKHARAGAVSLVPAGGRHFSVIYLFFLRVLSTLNITSLTVTFFVAEEEHAIETRDTLLFIQGRSVKDPRPDSALVLQVTSRERALALFHCSR